MTLVSPAKPLPHGEGFGQLGIRLLSHQDAIIVMQHLDYVYVTVDNNYYIHRSDSPCVCKMCKNGVDLLEHSDEPQSPGKILD